LGVLAVAVAAFLGFGYFAEGVVACGSQGRVLFGFEKKLFPSQFVIALQAIFIESVCGDGFADGAAGFGCVAAVSELAVASESLNVGEDSAETMGGVPELEFAHAGSVDDNTTSGDENELARGGGVAAAIIVGAHGGSELQLVADNCVDEGGFADSRRTEESCSTANADAFAQF